jgi:nitrite reductase (NO-forming)
MVKTISKYISLILVTILCLSFTKNILNKNTTDYFYQKKPTRKSINAGFIVYAANCVRCHETNGKGQDNVFPPLAKSDYLLEDLNRSIKIVLWGSNKSMKVNGKFYRGKMSGESHLSNQQISDLMNYINHSWGNKGGVTTSKMVKTIRLSIK